MKHLPVACLGCEARGRRGAGAVPWSRRLAEPCSRAGTLVSVPELLS